MNETSHSPTLESAPTLPIKKSQSAELRCFGVALFWFWLPVALAGIALEMVLWRTGEAWPIERVQQAQRADPQIIFMRNYLDQGFYHYKWSGLMKRRPSAIAIGSSRTMQWRSRMLGYAPDQSAGGFYNAGGMVRSIEDLAAFSRAVPADYAPRAILFGIDMWWLNDDYNNTDGFSAGHLTDGALAWQGHLLAMRKLARKPPVSRRKVWDWMLGRSDPRHLGIKSLLRGSGFRADGSLETSVPAPITTAGWRFIDRERPPIRKRILTGDAQFAPTTRLSAAKMALLRATLHRLKQRGVLVIGFAPPVSSEVAGLLTRSDGQRYLWVDYRRQLPALFADLDLPFFDASTPSTLGLDDRYMQDGIHAMETFHLHLLLRLLRDKRVRAALPHAEYAARSALASPKTNFWYADYGSTRPGSTDSD